MNDISSEQLLDIGIALSREKDGDKLFEIILKAAMDVTCCDGGTLYRKVDNTLMFSLMITLSNGTKKGGAYGEISLPPVQITRKNVCSCAVLDKMLINVADVYKSEKYDFAGPRSYDKMTGYKTTSMLVVPMEDDTGEIIGVLQLINAEDSDNNVIPFDKSCERVILSLASQAAICLTNMNYSAEVRGMFDSFVRVMSTAIDARTPYNANHTRNMVRYGAKFFDWIQNEHSENAVPLEERLQFLMSAWLHDVGKLTIPLAVMDKESRLGAEIKTFKDRIRVIGLLQRLDYANNKIDNVQYEALQQELANALELVEKANEAGFLQDEVVEALAKLVTKTFIDENGNVCPWLTNEEYEALSVRKGTLTAAERHTMESHVEMTAKMLGEIHFPKYYENVPEWASHHHELLDGSGYPEHLTAKQLPMQVRFLTVLDIFDALTARDRPYKKGMPPSKAFNILHSMASDGKLDENIISYFEKSNAWEE
ncbi:MAG: HD domain-containing phosphohydrolase [Oscillospiraceae bacterium]